MIRARAGVFAVVMLVFAAAGAHTQTALPAELVTRAIQAYDDLDFGTTVGLIGRALDSRGPDTLTTARRLDALSYLGAAELYRNRRAAAMGAFGRIVRRDPRYQVDELIFPPEVTSVFALVRRDTKVVQVVAPEVARIPSGAGRYGTDLFASSYHEISASITRSDGQHIRSIYGGLIGDSLEVVWDGLDSAGTPVASGRYFLTVQSRDRTGAVARVARVPLEIVATSLDTLPHPQPLAESLFLPERTGAGPGIGALLAGVVGGAGVVLLSSSFAPDTDLSSGRLVVGGAMTIGGLVGFLNQRRGRPIPANVARNDLVRRAWAAQRDSVVGDNRLRRATVDLEIRAGTPTAVDLLQQ
jgi:hypothetical protein